MKRLSAISAYLAARRQQGLYRERKPIDTPQQPEQIVDGRRLISFCSNDYLGLANHPKVIEALQQGASQYGVGSGAAHLVNGHSRAHHELEIALARLTQRPKALLFSCGYMANLGLLQALTEKGDLVFEDRLNHASLLDGVRLSGARLLRYQHLDMQHLKRRLAHFVTAPKTNTLLVTDSVFSMDGDIAPLRELAQMAAQYDAGLMVDDAHGLGVLGPGGGGALLHYGLNETEVPIMMGTLGKALGTAGAFVAGSEELIEYLVQSARTYIYTTALPAALAKATLASIDLLHAESWRQSYLHELIYYFRKQANQLGIRLSQSQTPIQPIYLGCVNKTLECSQRLLQAGFWIPAIRPPTVPEGTARLRISLTAAHKKSHIDQLLEVFLKT